MAKTRAIFSDSDTTEEIIEALDAALADLAGGGMCARDTNWKKRIVNEAKEILRKRGITF